MSDPDTLMTLTDPILADIVSTVVSDACLKTASRVKQGLREKRRGKEPQTNLEIVNSFIRPKAASEISLARLVALPSTSLTGHQLRGALGSHAVSAVVQQMLCAQITQASPDTFDKIHDSFVLALEGALGDTCPPDASFVAIADELHKLVLDSTGKAVTSTRDTPDREPLAEVFAQLTLIRASVDSINPLLGSLTQRKNEQLSQKSEDWKEKYKQQCSKYHGVITPPDFKERNTVPLDQIYVPARIAVADEATKTKSQRSLYEIMGDIDRHVLVGDPGGGKSTTTHAIAYRLAETPEGLLPFVVVLREYAQHSDALSIVEYIEKQLRTLYQAESPTGLLETILDAGEALVIFDGLDELIDASRRIAISQRIEMFSNRFPMSRVYVTSRKVGYKEARLDPEVFAVLELAPYETADVEEYVSKWFSIQHNSENVDTSALQRAFIQESAAIPDLRSNPLLLALLCIIYRGQGYLPKNRVGIYEECSKLLFETWDKSRGIVFDFTFESYISDALKHLAFWMWSDATSDEGVSEDHLIRELTNFFRGRAYETEDAARKAATEFVEFCSGRAWVLSEAGMTPENVSLFKFTHRTFMEFFAATQVNRLHPEPKALARFLLPKISRNEWDTVGQLCIHLIHRSADRGADVAIAQMLKSSESRSVVYRENVLDFIARCLVDLHIGPKLIKKVLRASIENLCRARSADSGKFKDSMWECTSWRRLCQLESAFDVVREELGTIIDELFASGKVSEQEVACLLLSELKYANSYPGLRVRPGGPNWNEFMRLKFRQHKSLIVSLPSCEDYMSVQAFINDAIDAPELFDLLTDEGDLPLDFLVRGLRMLTDSSTGVGGSLGATLTHIAYFRINNEERFFRNEINHAWERLLQAVYERVKGATLPYARASLYPSGSYQPWKNFIEESVGTPEANQADAWAFATLLTALHLELENNGSRKAGQSRPGAEGSLLRMVSDARAAKSELPAELLAVVETSSHDIARILNQWGQGHLNLIDDQDDPAA
jgi:NACHT domain